MRKKIGRICALVMVGMFVVMTSMSVPANDVDDWTRWGDNADPTWVLGTLNSQDLRIITASSQKMVVTTGGQVGIGTPGPTSMLEVRGSGNSPATSAFRVNDGFDTGLFFVRDDGNIGIGTLDPICTLHIKELTPGAETILALESESPSIIPGDHLGTIMFMGPYSGSIGAMIRAEATGAFVDVDPNVSPTGLQFYTQDATSGTGLLAPRMVIDEVGNVGIGTTSPGAKLDVEVSSGGAATVGSSGNLANGDYAIAMGYITTASGRFSTAMGGYTTASGDYSTATGFRTTASEGATTAMGQETIASGYVSTAMGYITTASGHYSTAMGSYTTASGDFSTAIGRTITVQGSESFGIGLEYNPSGWLITQDNTMAIMGGNVGIGTTNPTQKLHVAGSVRIEGAIYDGNNDPGTSGQVLSSTGTGIDWIDAPGLGLQDLWETIYSNDDSTSTTANSPTDTLYLDGQGIASISISGDTVIITATEVDGSTTNELQDLYYTMTDGTNSADADSQTDVFKFRGGGIVSVAVANDDPTHGDNVLISATEVDGDTTNEIQNLWETINSDAGSTTADSPTDMLNIYGAGIASTSISGDTLTITAIEVDGSTTNELQNLAEVYAHDGATGNAVQLTAANGDIRFYNDDATPKEMLFLDESSGRIGIGSTSPGAKLDVEVSSGGAATIGSIYNSATGDYTIAMGVGSDASGYVSTAMGFWTTANGDYSTAMGQQTTASGYSSTSMGYMTTASGYGSTAMGIFTTASGNYATAMGRRITVQGDYSFGIGLDDTSRTITQDNTMAIMGGNVGIGTVSPVTTLDVDGGFATNIVTKYHTDDGYTPATSDYTILVDADSATQDLDINLPAASGREGQILVIKRIDDTTCGHDVIINRAGSDLIDGSTSKTLDTQWESLTIQSGGSNWYILASQP